jgi:hypothetical protein
MVTFVTIFSKYTIKIIIVKYPGIHQSTESKAEKWGTSLKHYAHEEMKPSGLVTNIPPSPKSVRYPEAAASTVPSHKQHSFFSF